MSVTLLATERRWYCPKCGKTDITHEARPHTRFHACPKLRGLTAPFLPAGTKAKVELVEREDYVGKEVVRLDPELGRPVMAVKTTRDDGEDVIVFAPTATGSTGG
jgi:predicted RNA-binding Zn-ribbon protein involved in translation (DUF1610 family)